MSHSHNSSENFIAFVGYRPKEKGILIVVNEQESDTVVNYLQNEATPSGMSYTDIFNHVIRLLNRSIDESKNEIQSEDDNIIKSPTVETFDRERYDRNKFFERLRNALHSVDSADCHNSYSMSFDSLKPLHGSIKHLSYLKDNEKNYLSQCLNALIAITTYEQWLLKTAEEEIRAKNHAVEVYNQNNPKNKQRLKKPVDPIAISERVRSKKFDFDPLNPIESFKIIHMKVRAHSGESMQDYHRRTHSLDDPNTIAFKNYNTQRINNVLNGALLGLFVGALIVAVGLALTIFGVEPIGPWLMAKGALKLMAAGSILLAGTAAVGALGGAAANTCLEKPMLQSDNTKKRKTGNGKAVSFEENSQNKRGSNFNIDKRLGPQRNDATSLRVDITDDDETQKVDMPSAPPSVHGLKIQMQTEEEHVLGQTKDEDIFNFSPDLDCVNVTGVESGQSFRA